MNSSNHVQLLSDHFHLVYTMHEIVSPLLVLGNTYIIYIAMKLNVLQKFSDSSQSVFLMISDNAWKPEETELPLVIHLLVFPTIGSYVYQEIREYCRPGTEG